MKQPLHFGRFLANNLFRTSEGEFFLSSSPEGDLPPEFEPVSMRV